MPAPAAKCSTEAEFAQVLDLMENTIGIARARVFHSHFSHIEYGPKGEVRHLTFADEQYGPGFCTAGQADRTARLDATVYL